ncbi:MAG: hypothetical protein JSV91_09690, partial [Phycisphaerales bacterium]
MSDRRTLVILPALRARRADNGNMVLTRKFVDGLKQYAERWPGPVSAWIGLNESADSNLDHVEVEPEDGNLSLHWFPDDHSRLDEMLSNARFVLASLVDRHLHMAGRCVCLNIPLAFVSEYTLRTRRQIIRAETGNRLLRWR